MTETIISKRDLRAGEVCRELQEWLENVEGTSGTPIVALTITFATTTIEVGGVVVWNCQDNDDAELNFDFCKKAFQDEILELTNFTDII